MPPNRYSRHRFTTGTVDDAGKFFLSERVPYRYRNLTDNRQHVVKRGDTIFNLAGRYFTGMPRASGLWWIIADFQPDPIHDPTLELLDGALIVIPSLRTVQEEILSESRKRT